MRFRQGTLPVPFALEMLARALRRLAPAAHLRQKFDPLPIFFFKCPSDAHFLTPPPLFSLLVDVVFAVSFFCRTRAATLRWSPGAS